MSTWLRLQTARSPFAQSSLIAVPRYDHRFFGLLLPSGRTSRWAGAVTALVLYSLTAGPSGTQAQASTPSAVPGLAGALGAGGVEEAPPPEADTVTAPTERLGPFTSGTPAAYYAALQAYLREKHSGITQFLRSRDEIFNDLEGGCEAFGGKQPQDPWTGLSGRSTNTGGIRKVLLRPLRTQRNKISVTVEIRAQVAETSLDGLDPKLSTIFSVGRRFDCGGYGRRVVRLTLWKMVKRSGRTPRIRQVRGRGASRTIIVNGDAYGGLATPILRTVRLTDPGRRNRRGQRWLVGISSGYTKHPARYTGILRVSPRPRKAPYLRNPNKDDLKNQA